jgi:hypothetical protein
VDTRFVSIHDPEFIDVIRAWIEANGEIFVVIEDLVAPHVAYAIFTSAEEFLEKVSSLTSSAKIYVLSEPQLPLRGQATTVFLEKALKEIEEPGDFLLLSLEENDFNTEQWFAGDYRGELQAKFDDFSGKFVAFGKMPSWFGSDRANLKSAYVIIQVPPLSERKVILQEVNKGERVVERDKLGERTKLGGVPDWIQHDDTPICSSCHNFMTFVAQIDSIDFSKAEAGEYMFGDVGMIYVFFCFECSETESVFQCY